MRPYYELRKWIEENHPELWKKVRGATRPERARLIERDVGMTFDGNADADVVAKQVLEIYKARADGGKE